MNFNDILPYKVLLSLKDLENLGVIKISMAKKLINKGELVAVKIGWKLFIARDEVIRFLNKNIVGGTTK